MNNIAQESRGRTIVLEAEGFIVVCYSDGETAQRSLQANPVDLVELDIKMPRMDGLELLQCLREKSRIRLNFLTSKADEVDEIWGLRLGGAATIITKPFSQRLRIERIHTLLSRKFRRADDDFSEIETLYGVGYRYRTV